MDKVVVRVLIKKPIDLVYKIYNDPKHVIKWNQASPDWHSPYGTNDLRVGGKFSYRMEAIDGSEGFDFSGTYLEISNTHIKYMLDDGRIADVNFIVEGEKTAIEIMFDPETTYPKEFQQQGWQAILDSFKNYIEKL